MNKMILTAAVMLAAVGARAERNGEELDRRQYEVIRREYGYPFQSDSEWMQVRNKICEQKDGREYEFFVELIPKFSAVMEAKTESEAIDALTELEEYVSKRGRWYCKEDFEIWGDTPGKRRCLSNAALDYLLSGTENTAVKRVVEGWLALSGKNVTVALDRTVLECGFTPGARVPPGLQEKFDTIAEKGLLCDDNGNPVYRWKGNTYMFRREVWHYRWSKTEKLFVCLDNISKEMAQLSAILGKMKGGEVNRKKHAMKAKSTLKAALAKIDREAKMYSSLQSDKFSRWLDMDEDEKWDLRLEALEAHRKLLECIGEMASVDAACKKMVDERLTALARHVSSVEKKRPAKLKSK